LFLAQLVSSCRRTSPEAGAHDDRRVACGSACAALVTAGCGVAGLEPSDQPRCVERCVELGVEADGARCGEVWRGYLACVARARVDCSVRCSAAVCLEHRQAIEGCADEHAALQRCSLPCAHAGVRSLIDREGDGAPGLKAEIVLAGCAACPQTSRAAPTDSVCEAASVCSQACCACPDGRARYLARACVDGRCASDTRSCEMSRAAARVDPCTGVARRR